MAKTTTMAFSIDTSGFSKGLKEASNSLKIAKATFEANTAGMTGWSKSADGVREKLKLLSSQQEAYSKKTELLKNQISSINSAYEENGKKADQLRAKKASLEQAGDTESKAYQQVCKELKSTESQMQSQQRTIEKHEQSLQMEELALTRVSNESTKWESELQNLENAEQSAKSSGEALAQGMDDIADQAEQSSISIGDVASTMQEMFSGAISKIGELAQKCLDARAEVDSAYDSVAQGTGAVGENLKAMQGIADEVFRDLPVDIGDTGAAVADINTYFGFTGEALKKCTEAFIKFNRVNGASTESIGQVKKMMADAGVPLQDYQKMLDLLTTTSQASGMIKFNRVNGASTESIGQVKKMMADAGVPLQDYQKMLDLLTTTSQASGMTIGELSSGLQTNGAMFRSMGMTLEESIAYLGLFNQQGINSGTMLTGFNKLIQNATKEGYSASASFENFVEGVSKGTVSAKDAMELFGKKAGNVFYNYAKEATKEGYSASASFENFVEGVSKGTVSAKDAMELFGKKAGNVFYNYAKEGKLNIKDFQAVIKEYSGQTQRSYDEIADAMDNVTVVQNNMKSASAKIGEVLVEKMKPGLDFVQGIAQAIMDLSPEQLEQISAGVTSLGIALLSLGVATLITNTVNALNAMKTATESATIAQALLNTVMNMNPIGLIITAIGALIAGFTYFYTTNEGFATFINGLWDGQALLNTVMNMNPIGLIITAIGALIAGFTYFYTTNEGFATFINGLWDGIKQTFNGFLEFLQPFWDGISTWFLGIWQTIKQWFDELKNIISGFSKHPMETIGKLLGWVLGKVSSFHITIISKIIEIGANLLQAIGAWIGQVPAKIGDILTNAYNKVRDWATKLLTTGENAGKSLSQALWDTLKSLPGKMWKIGTNIVMGIWNGIGSMVGWIGNKIAGFAGGMLDGFKSALGIHSPSKAFEMQARFIPEGIAEGIKKASGEAYDALNDLSVGMMSNFNPNLEASANNRSGQGLGGYTIYNQTINAPKQLDLREIHRQSKNLLAFSKM